MYLWVAIYVQYIRTVRGPFAAVCVLLLVSREAGGRQLVLVSCLKEDHKSSIRFSSCFSILSFFSTSTCPDSSSVSPDPGGILSFLHTRTSQSYTLQVKLHKTNTCVLHPNTSPTNSVHTQVCAYTLSHTSRSTVLCAYTSVQLVVGCTIANEV